MDSFREIVQQFSTMQWQDYLDIALVALLLYWCLPILRSRTTIRIAGAVAGLLIITWLTSILKLHTLNFLLTSLMTVGLLALVILFQPELRRMLDHLGNMKIRSFFEGMEKRSDVEPLIHQVILACETMSREKVGALIVFSRAQGLDEYIKTGTVIDAEVSEQLIRNIFFPKASLHDGAMIIRDGRVAAAGCVLPLSDSKRMSADLGTRHRAGVGMSEVSDAVVVIVSEETGTISVAEDGMLKRHLAPQMLEQMLHTALGAEETEKAEHSRLRLRQKMTRKEKGDR